MAKTGHPAPISRINAAVVHGAVPEERRALNVMGEVRRVGRWLVPRLFRVRTFLGEVKLDLRECDIPQDFTLDVKGFGSRVTLIVPPGTVAAYDVFVLMGNRVNQADEIGGSEQLRVHVRGSLVLGEVRVLVRQPGS